MGKQTFGYSAVSQVNINKEKIGSKCMQNLFLVVFIRAKKNFVQIGPGGWGIERFLKHRSDH